MGSLVRRITAATTDTHGLTQISKPASWLVEALGGGGKSATGLRITPDTAMRVTTAWRCVQLLSWLRAYLPLKVMRAVEPKGAKVDREHPCHRLLAFSSDGWRTPFERRVFTGQSLFWRGHSLEVIERGPDGTPLSLIPIHPDRFQVYVDVDGYPIYRVTLFPSNEVQWYSRFEVNHLWLVSSNGYTGLSPVEIFRESFGLALGGQEFVSRIMSGGGMIAGVLEIPPNLTPELEAEVKASWRSTHATSVENVGKVAALKHGVKFTPVGMKLTDAQWIEMMNLSAEQVCQIWGVPPALAGHTAPASSWGTGEIARYMGFLATTVDPILIADEQRMQLSLFTPDEFEKVWPQYSRAALLRTDLLTRYRSYAIGRQWGWLTTNNVLDFEDMNPVGPEGDVLLDPTNMVRIPVDPTAILDAGDGYGTGDQAAAAGDRVAAFLQKALNDGASGADGAHHG